MSDDRFEYVKPSFVSKDVWSKSGANAVADIIKTKLADSVVLKQVLYELFWHIIQGKLVAKSAVDMFQQLMKDGIEIGVLQVAIAETCWFLGLEVTQYESEDEKLMSKWWKSLCTLVGQMVDSDIVESKMLLENLEVDLLEGAGLGDAKVMSRRLVKANTNNLYRQERYNLLREESEGYAKLITELGSIDSSNVIVAKRNIQSLVGYFHLDPNRVFDLILDAYEIDPTNTSFQELLSLFRGSNLCQIIGFKLQMYQRPEITQSTPRSLYWFILTLIATGKLDPLDLLPHCNPSLATLRKQYGTYLDSLKQEARGIGRVSLNAAKADPGEKKKAEETAAALNMKKAEKDLQDAQGNQHFNLVAGALELGLWSVAKGLMDKYAKFGIRHATDSMSVQRALLTLIHTLIEPVYSKISPRQFGFSKDTSESSSVKGSYPMGLPTHERQKAEHVASKLPGVVSPATSYHELMTVVGPMIVLAGHRVGHDVLLMTKLCRLCEDLLKNYPEECTRTSDSKAPSSVTRSWLLRIIGTTLLPSLSMVESPNPSLVMCLWEVISQFGYKARFDLYERWRTGSYEVVPELTLVKAKAGYDARQVLKRMANEREMMRIAGRRFAKVSHGNPLVTFSALLNNIQAYDNLIPVVVDAIKYLTPLGFDCLAYLLITYLSKNESKLKEDGQSHSHWLNSLCKFAGYFYHKYPHVELGGLWHYLAGQLIAKQPLDLLVLEEVVAKMTGLEVVVDFSDDMLKAMAGGDTLREQARAALGTSATSKKRQIARLRQSLENESIVVPLLILIAQQRESTIFESNTKQLKLIGHLYDKGTSVLVQYAEFLATQISPDRYGEMIPSLSELHTGYSIEPVVAFHVTRPAIKYTQQILYKAEEVLFALENSTAKVTDEAKQQASDKVSKLKTSQWAIGSEAMEKEIRKLCDESVWERISPKLYSLFWSLSLYDIFTPRAQYDSEVARCIARHESLERGEETLAPRRRAFEIQKCKENVTLLKKELSLQISNHNRVLDNLRDSLALLFPKSLDSQNTVNEFMQQCILPRALFSSEDALYCARFVLLLHSLGVPGLSTVNLFDKLARNVLQCVFCITEREAGNFTVFLRTTFAQLLKWRNDKKLYSKECESKPGFSSSFTNDSARITHAQYQGIYDGWHARITQTLLNALESDSYMQVRPALLVCSKIVDVFPNGYDAAQRLKASTEVLTKSGKYQDLQTMAKRYEALLKKLIKGGKLRGTPTKQTENVGKKAQQQQPSTKKAENSKSMQVDSDAREENTNKKNSKKDENQSHDEDDGEIKETPRQVEKPANTSSANNSSNSNQRQQKSRDDPKTASKSETSSQKPKSNSSSRDESGKPSNSKISERLAKPDDQRSNSKGDHQRQSGKRNATRRSRSAPRNSRGNAPPVQDNARAKARATRDEPAARNRDGRDNAGYNDRGGRMGDNGTTSSNPKSGRTNPSGGRVASNGPSRGRSRERVGNRGRSKDRGGKGADARQSNNKKRPRDGREGNNLPPPKKRAGNESSGGRNGNESSGRGGRNTRDRGWQSDRGDNDRNNKNSRGQRFR